MCVRNTGSEKTPSLVTLNLSVYLQISGNNIESFVGKNDFLERECFINKGKPYLSS